MVAMTPLITIQLVGLAFKIKTDAQKKHQKLAEPFAEEEILDLSKEDALNCWFAAMNHAMVLTGVNLDENGKPTRWKIENSWGDKNGAKGYYVCSDSWFDQYVFQAAVEEEFLGGMQSLLAQEPIELAPWDPMGTLAD